MTLSQKRKAIVEKHTKDFIEHDVSIDYTGLVTYFDGQLVTKADIQHQLTQALNDYTQSIIEMVEGMKSYDVYNVIVQSEGSVKPDEIDTHREQMYNNALNDIKEALTNNTK